MRELRNMVERAIILCKGNSLGISDFWIKPQNTEANISKNGVIDLKTNEIKLIKKALQICEFNQQAAANTLGITRDALIRKMKKYNISICRSEN